MEFLYEYGLFLAKTATLVLAIGLVIGLIAGAAAAKNKAKKGQLQFTDLSEHYQSMAEDMQQHLLQKKQFKQWQKTQRAARQDNRPKLFVLDFNGSLDAKETESLREEVTAILAVANQEDEVLLRLESGGGVVHGYGLAASQLDRLRQHPLNLTVAIDKVAASGGYMMACIGNTILAAPFAIVGSIGVIAQLPNFNKLLKKHSVDFEQFTAGEYKRTVTLFGENTDKGRQKFQHELEDTHQLFKQFVLQHRPQLDIDKVATGEHWFGHQALALNLVDTIQTSDDYILTQMSQRQVFQVKYQLRKGIAEKVGMGSASIVSHYWQRLIQHSWIR
ncbi:MAG: protease SohB [Alteromonadaceae bacterium]|uniref:protease SohB n=1 Tax=Rheinheimera TaxID=67575 RepID=UPI000C48798A|nr:MULTISPECIES: protease SohB [Rheinheimera]MBJ91267.1 protease SohB [Alteromonadaceae bacterium]MCD1597949.1 protease SohB [Rheinheimera aquimaris]HBN90090.1 protease SohB [Rheinheimera sp.]